MPLAGEYLAVLEPLARAFVAYARASGHTPVLVGGAAVAIYTDGKFLSNDFDVVASLDQAFEAAMLEQGFLKEDRTGQLLVGFYHPDHPRFGVQQVTGPLFDGRSDGRRLLRFTVQDASVVLPSIEDMIADRLAQHAVASPTDRSRLDQARELLDLADGIDVDYLRRRIGQEGGDPGLLGLRGADEDSEPG